jgi:low temperature requirement protein LtrA
VEVVQGAPSDLSANAPDEPDHLVEREQRVTPLELFFDLVFVFAITQVTSLLSADPTWRGLGRGLLVLGALWLGWAAYAWLTDAIDHDEGWNRLVMFVSMAALLVAAMATPRAFGNEGVLFGCAYFVLRAVHIGLYAKSARDGDATRAIFRLARTAIPAAALLIVAGFLDGTTQAALWVAALAIDFSGPYVFGLSGFSISAGHFAERFGLIVIIALGESIVSIGVGASGTELGAGIVTAAVLGLAVSAALWWAYFDTVAVVAERKLRAARGYAQVAIARDSYSYLHLPMLAGIVLFALGTKKTVAHVGEPLDTVPAVALCGGVAMYLLAHIAFRLRNVHSLNRQRLVAALVCVALIPLATTVDALVALAAVTVVCCTLIAFEAIHFREARARVRAARS